MIVKSVQLYKILCFSEGTITFRRWLFLLLLITDAKCFLKAISSAGMCTSQTAAKDKTSSRHHVISAYTVEASSCPDSFCPHLLVSSLIGWRIKGAPSRTWMIWLVRVLIVRRRSSVWSRESSQGGWMSSERHWHTYVTFLTHHQHPEHSFTMWPVLLLSWWLSSTNRRTWWRGAQIWF